MFQIDDGFEEGLSFPRLKMLQKRQFSSPNVTPSCFRSVAVTVAKDVVESSGSESAAKGPKIHELRKILEYTASRRTSNLFPRLLRAYDKRFGKKQVP